MCFRCRKDEFLVECPGVGTLKRIRIAHDNSGAGPGWFLDKVGKESHITMARNHKTIHPILIGRYNIILTEMFILTLSNLI